MFTIPKVIVNNFRSWVGTHEWVINQEPGLYYLSGWNHDTPRLGRNGLGKSSLLDAMCWCAYGRSTRALRGPGVVSRGHNSCFVACMFMVDSEQFTITRTYGPNSLKINGEIVDQEAVNKKLRLNFESFLYAVISPQSGHSFLDLSAGEKLNLFSSIMELDYWLEASEKAAKRTKEIEDEKYITNQAISRFTGIATSLATTISDLKIKAEAFETNKVSQLNALTNKHIEIESKIADAEGKINRIEATIPTRAEFEVAIAKIVDHTPELEELDNELAEAYNDQGQINHGLNCIETERINLAKVGPKCPTCKQKMDEAHLMSQLSALSDEKQKLLEAKVDYENLVKTIKSKKNKIHTAMTFSDTAYNKLKERERIANEKLVPLLRELDQFEYQYKTSHKEYERIEKSVNEYEGLVIKKKAELEAANQEVSDRKSDLSRLNEEWAAAHFWVAGFKRVRLFIIEDALNTLEVEVNNNLTALGMGNWKINFDVERENKSGGITRGFTTMITDPKGNTVPYDTLSFGETQRVKLAGCFGLANLIMERIGLSSKFEVYDEITQHMSAEGIEDTLNILRDRAIMNNKVVILIDHQAIEYGDFSGTINIIRDETGSRFADA